MNVEIAKKAAILYVDKRYETLKTKSGFTLYYIRVGLDQSRVETPIFADELPVHPLTLMIDKDAITAFSEHCNYNEEYLVKVWVDFKANKYETKILWGD